ncbi:sperm microtubule inner protein 6 isoform X2 [Pelodiscus sinensis]|uniref:sperm microtubule inner protein 6 isoform X2 n=1 Tax=Pelodiscus sinensis TaxID=13735 RepID=UPI000D722AE8|nr:spermatid-specific manchette-related protein 1 isoform X4 [Pelodiscus sinensis]|eukprot:XP_025040380.1 spermatid-specific manchette-related protein 1 isoform X4 [Pelodiscus sinensis]
MFLFARKTKTPISTYTDCYRPPNSMRKTFQEAPMTLWKENKFVTEGLKMPRVENQVNQAHLEKMIKHAVQEYSYKNTIEPTAYRPEKYWVTRPEEKYNPVFVSGDKYATWRTGPYNSAGWNKYTTYLPRLPKEAGMETILRGMPMQYPPKPDRLNNYEREVVVNMLNSLSRNQLPSVQHQTVLPGRKPFQGYYSPCTGRHYCLRGMDYYVDGAPCNERQLNQLVEKIEYPILRLQPRDDGLCTHAQLAAIFPVYEP